MAHVRALLAQARKNLPPLKTTVSTDEIVLVENNPRSLVDKLYKHCQNDLTHDDANNTINFKWCKIKEKMITDMENKRDEEWKRNLNELDEEEGLEENDIFLTDNENQSTDPETVDKLDCIDANDNNASIEEDEEDDNVDEEAKEDDGSSCHGDDAHLEHDEDIDKINDGENSEDQSEIEDETPVKNIESLKQFFNDENSDNDDDCFIMRKRQKVMQLSDDEPEDEIASNNDFSNDQTDDFYQQNGFLSQKPDEQFISQNLPLTPFYTPSASASNMPNTDGDVNYDSQMLVDLCSGQFNDAVNSQKDDCKLSDDDLDQDVEDDSDHESEVDIKVPKRSLYDFVEDEAELSGSEASSDEDEDQLDEDDEFFEDKNEDLPSQDELRNQVEKLFNKDMIDEDKRQLMILKERFFEDGDLYDGTGDRKKKFKWVLSGEEANEFSTLISDSDVSDDNVSDEDEGGHVIRLKKASIESTTGNSATDGESTSARSNSIRATTRNKIPFESYKLKNTKKSQVSLSSFVIRDQRLKEILNKKPGANDPCGRKKGQESMSIFDVLNS